MEKLIKESAQNDVKKEISQIEEVPFPAVCV